jgi:hypothetical protein
MFGFEGTCERPQRDYECLSGIVMCLVEYPLCSSADELAVRSSVLKRHERTMHGTGEPSLSTHSSSVSRSSLGLSCMYATPCNTHQIGRNIISTRPEEWERIKMTTLRVQPLKVEMYTTGQRRRLEIPQQPSLAPPRIIS